MDGEDLEKRERELKEQELNYKEAELLTKEVELAEKQRKLLEELKKEKKKGQDVSSDGKKLSKAHKKVQENVKKDDGGISFKEACCCCLAIILISAVVSHFTGDVNTDPDINYTANNSYHNINRVNVTTSDSFTYYSTGAEYLGNYTFTLTVNNTTYCIKNTRPLRDNLETFSRVYNYSLEGRLDNLSEELEFLNPNLEEDTLIFSFPVDMNFSFKYKNFTYDNVTVFEITKVYF